MIYMYFPPIKLPQTPMPITFQPSAPAASVLPRDCLAVPRLKCPTPRASPKVQTHAKQNQCLELVEPVGFQKAPGNIYIHLQQYNCRSTHIHMHMYTHKITMFHISPSPAVNQGHSGSCFEDSLHRTTFLGARQATIHPSNACKKMQLLSGMVGCPRHQEIQ